MPPSSRRWDSRSKLLPPRIFFSSSQAPEIASEIQISERDSHHLLNVLRLKSGDRLSAVHRETGRCFDATLTLPAVPAVARLDEESSDTDPRPIITSVTFALAKGSKNDEVCEKLTEIGVENIIFWQSSRSVVRFRDEDDRLKKQVRWERIAESAAKQSLKTFIPKVRTASKIEQALEQIRDSAGADDSFYLCSLSEGALSPKSVRPPRGGAHLVIGPEGDLTREEEERFVSAGFERITLGPYRLRAETAALVGAVAIQSIWGSW